MEPIEMRAVKALMEVSFGHNKNACAFVSRVYLTANSDAKWPITLNDRAHMWALVWTYRRQISDAGVVARADDLVNGTPELAFNS